MQVSITGHHVELTDALKQHIEDKLQHLKHSLDHVVNVHAVLSVEKYRQRCEINMQVSGINIHASKETEDMYASIDGVISKLNRQLKRYRAKLRKHKTDHDAKGRQIEVAHRVLGSSSDEDELAENHQVQFADHKVIQAAPMSVDDAVMQMELEENKAVLFFVNADTNALNAMYRREDGGLSWIEPEAAK